jgi:hypothetical protein
LAGALFEYGFWLACVSTKGSKRDSGGMMSDNPT